MGGLPEAVASPTGEGAIGLHAAGVEPSSADGDEGPARWAGLPEAVVPPAGEDAVGLDPAGVRVPGADGSEGPARWAGVMPTVHRARHLLKS